MTTTVEQGRGLLGFLSPLCGTRATGKLTIVPKTGTVGTTLLGPNWWLYPVINGALRTDLVYRILPNYGNTDPADYTWSLPPGGGPVNVEAHVGGSRYNLPAGTVMLFADDVPDGLDGDTSVTVETSGITGGLDVPLVGRDRLFAVAQYEEVGQAQIALDLFRSTVGAFPAALIVWNSGATDSTFVGRGRQGYRERFELLIVCDNSQGEARRRGEGLRLLDNAHDQILWKQIYGDDLQQGGGIVISAIHHANVVGRFRLPLTKEWAQYYVYGLRIEATRVAIDAYKSNAQALQKARIKAQNPDANPPGDANPLTLVDETVNFPQ